MPAFYEPVYSEEKFNGIKTLISGIPSVITKRTVDLEHSFYPESFIVPYMKVVHDRAMLELFRGCTQGCRFCQAGIIYRPVRNRSISRLRALAKNIIAKTGLEELSLVSLSTSDYPGIEELVQALEEELRGKEVQLSLPSLRADSFALRLANRVQKNRGGGVTFAPEAGTQRLRNVINKRITRDEILGAAEEALSSGRNHIKLYFMLGLPTEEDEDLLGIAACPRFRLLKMWKRKKFFHVAVSAATFVPKSHTPFNGVRFLSRRQRRQDLVGREFHSNRKVDLPGMMPMSFGSCFAWDLKWPPALKKLIRWADWMPEG